jgi:hypothetical protein
MENEYTRKIQLAYQPFGDKGVEFLTGKFPILYERCIICISNNSKKQTSLKFEKA